MWTLVVVFLLTLALGNPVEIDEEEYVLNFDSPIYVCPDERSQSFVDTSKVTIKRINETTSIMSGKILFLKGFEEGTMIELVVEKEIGASYQRVVSHDICDVCKELGDPDSPYNEYGLTNFGFPSECPFDAGHYPISDYTSNSKDLPVNSATVGRYQVTLNLYKNTDGECNERDDFIGCLKLDFLVESLE